jgi:hypothetical protein
MYHIKKNMNFKPFYTIVLLFLISSTSVIAQKRENNIDEEFPPSIAFPYSYFGDYSGNLRVSDNSGVIANLPTEFSFNETEIKDEFVYTLAFIKGKGEKEIQTFKMKIIDETKGFYAITDASGMEFTATLIDSTLYSTFEINNNIMFTALEFNNSGKIRLLIHLANKIINNRTEKLKIDQARSSNVMLVQKAVLSKINK